MIFDKDYFDSVWPGQGVHRHDYCPYWADRLKGKRILDVGTGCGYLVKLLRERGVEAWGIDSSKYAIANTCAPGFVLKASVLDIPFQDDFFDLVFSNGLWEYIEEADVPRGRDEIWRVGREQCHEIDHSSTDFREDFVTWKPMKWWDEQLAAPKILIGCPTHQCKAYAAEAWVNNIKKTDYPNFDVAVVDNSPNSDHSNRWEFSHIETGNADACERMALSMEVIRQKFLSGNYYKLWNVEIDVIPHPAMLKTLLKYGKGADWVAHCYPPRGGTVQSCSGLGCSLFSRKLMEDFTFVGSGSRLNQCVDAYFWNWVLPQSQYKTREFWSHLPIAHLKEPEGTSYGC